MFYFQGFNFFFEFWLYCQFSFFSITFKVDNLTFKVAFAKSHKISGKVSSVTFVSKFEFCYDTGTEEREI